MYLSPSEPKRPQQARDDDALGMQIQVLAVNEDRLQNPIEAIQSREDVRGQDRGAASV